MKQAEFLNERWNFHRDMMDAPKPKTLGQECNDRHGGKWDWWVWKGESYSAERAYCGSCGKLTRGVVSPWAAKALEDWKNGSGYQRRQYERMVEAQRKAAKFERPGWSRTWFGGAR